MSNTTPASPDPANTPVQGPPPGYDQPPPGYPQQPPPSGYYQQPPPGYYQQQPPAPRNGIGLAAIIVGMAGLVFGLVPLTGFIAIILGLTGLALGLAALGRVRRRQATNKWTTRIAVLVSAGAMALGIWGMTIVFGAVEDLDEGLDCIAEADTPEQIEACE
ncbi:DUF4190 domain-containing protein [Jiangella mangrovi]|uniref:DUF4190 domain-containing protein n=1 Tax=Jiangella mangrovi TaxID=1524084 RepID=A0A7W9GVC0_9ACTN|nr:DUF4190 domain-containing protein [Jiangella mangrovi]MBB5790742.1 hypothetical protein [Jiangella mangrovi]